MLFRSRRIGHARWLRNVAVALGNALACLPANDSARAPSLAALATRQEHPDEIVREHVAWAMRQVAENQRSNRFASG